MEKGKEFKIVKYEKGEISLDVRYDEENKTIWLTQSDICAIFNKDKTTISRHLSIAEKLPNYRPTVAWDATVQIEGKRTIKRPIKLYNLDMIETIYSKTKSESGYEFIKWANELTNNYENNTHTDFSLYEGNNYEIATFCDGDFSLDIRVSPNEDTVWLTKDQMAILFDRDRSVISKHIANIYNEGELEGKSNVHFLHVAFSDKPIQIYSLDVIISVGYRVKSSRGAAFRIWANKILKQYLMKGYAINQNRVQAYPENYLNLISDVNNIKSTIISASNKIEENTKKIAEHEKKIEELTNKDSIFNGYVLFENEFYKAYSFTKNLIKNAKEEIIVSDDYFDISVFDMLYGIDTNIKVTIYTLKNAPIRQREINKFKEKYPLLTVIRTNRIHFRVLVIDEEIYQFSYSFKDLGKRRTCVSKFLGTKEMLFSGLDDEEKEEF